jgi:hypothetical protein
MPEPPGGIPILPKRSTTMSAASTAPAQGILRTALAAAAVSGLVFLAGTSGLALPSAEGQDPANPAAAKPAARTEGQAVPTAREILGAPAVAQLAEQPAAKIIIDPPLPDQLTNGRAVIQYRTENLRVLPVFGPAAAAVSPRIGHLHVTLDDSPWVWGHLSGEELIIGGLPPGPHKILIDLASANHKPLAQGVVKFEVPPRSVTPPGPKADGEPLAGEPPAKIVLDPPRPDLLANGVAFIRYRTENLQIASVFGPAALAVSPRIGHLHVTVDDAPWHWADASGYPVLVGHLPPGPHKILIELVNANHEPVAQGVAKFEVPPRSKD